MLLIHHHHEHAGRAAAIMTSKQSPMNSSQTFVRTAFRRILRRDATALEIGHYSAIVEQQGHTFLLDHLFDSDEYRHRNEINDRSEFWPGHFYSPVVNPEELRAAGFHVDRSIEQKLLNGIDLRPRAMTAFWDRHIDAILALTFPSAASPTARYHTNNDVFSRGDAMVLFAIMREAKPQRIVEIGSGFSSAWMLDSAEKLGLEIRFTFIDPHPERLLGLLRNGDWEKCEVLQEPVQAASLKIFDILRENDILFVDSTHVLKTGSDVNHELFNILPLLAPGVIIHFHDVFYPFEYPEKWLFESRRSWNEIYALRAFLTGNRDYEVLFFNDFFWAKGLAKGLLQEGHLGGGLWLRKLIGTDHTGVAAGPE